MNGQRSFGLLKAQRLFLVCRRHIFDLERLRVENAFGEVIAQGFEDDGGVAPKRTTLQVESEVDIVMQDPVVVAPFVLNGTVVDIDLVSLQWALWQSQA
jgi:hypothetical protein